MYVDHGPPHPWICLEKRSSDNGHGTRRWTTPGSLVFPRMRAPPGRARWTRPRLPKLPRTQKVRVGRKISEPSSAVMCAKSTDIHIYSQMEYEHDFYKILLYKCLFLLFKYIFIVQTLIFLFL